MHVVWIRRDARIHDHGPLHTAVRSALSTGKPLLVLYIYDPFELRADTFDESHLHFINSGLTSLDHALSSLFRHGGGRLVCRVGPSDRVLAALHARCKISGIYLHDDVDTSVCMSRVVAARNWAKGIGIPFSDRFRQDGVIPTGRPKDGWATLWSRYMNASQHTILPCEANAVRFVSPEVVAAGGVASPEQLGQRLRHRGKRPGLTLRGGEEIAKEVLQTFLNDRVHRYMPGLSSPVTAWDACSRLSPYLSWGHISLRTVFQAVSAVQADARNGKRHSGTIATNNKQKQTLQPPLKCLSAFTARLRWRSHFTQKLHDSANMETHNVCRVYDTLSPPRITNIDHPLVQAWIHGRTGYPLIDACMRSLHETGWLNFRMRAMVTSFATYMLWIDWKCIAAVLARLFIDFAPGIHYPQLQMQAGTTGINALRMYNPTKQARDHDPDGEFVRRYVAELRGIPRRYVVTPWEMMEGGGDKKKTMEGKAEEKEDEHVLPGGYPARPVVDFGQAYALARKRFAEVRGTSEAKAQSAKIMDLHGSRLKRHRATDTGDPTPTMDGKKKMKKKKNEEDVEVGKDAVKKTRPRTCSVCGAQDHMKGPRCAVYVRDQEENSMPSSRASCAGGPTTTKPKYRQMTLK